MKTDYRPKLLFLEITSECNLKCRQCFLWKSKDNESRLSDNEYLCLLDEFYRINRTGAVVLTGGEVFSKSDLVFLILNKCNRMNIETVINTNGTIIPAEKFQALITDGPHKLVFSIDSQREKLHDYIRGTKGTFSNVVHSINRLIGLRCKAKSTDKKIYISTILHNENIDEIDEIISFAKRLKVDGITFQVLTPTFNSKRKIENDYFFKNYFFRNIGNAITKIDKLAELSSRDSFVLNSLSELSNIKDYIQNPLSTNKSICKAYEKNLIIDHVGNIKYCYNMEAVFPKQIGNVRFDMLSDIIHSDKSKEARERMKSCNLSCGILNCNN